MTGPLVSTRKVSEHAPFRPRRKAAFFWRRARRRRGEAFSQAAIRVTFLLMTFAFLYPFLYCLSYSLSYSLRATVTDMMLFPAGFTFQNYFFVFANAAIIRAFFISVSRTAVGIVWALVVTGLAAYGISRKALPFKRMISIFFVIPMYISGGLLPTYVLMHDLHLFNNFLVYILPHGFWAFNMLLMRTYFDTIPDSLEEASRMDGASELRILVQVVVPLSMPVISVIAMYVGVWHWNEWFEPLLYVTRSGLKPLQSILQRIIMESMGSAMEAQSGRVAEHAVSSTSIQMATLVVSTVPIILIYPFFQRYFIQGVMIGAVKA